MVAVNGDAMPAFAGRPLGRELLPDPRGRPVPRVRPETAEQVADHGVEWARHSSGARSQAGSPTW